MINRLYHKLRYLWIKYVMYGGSIFEDIEIDNNRRGYNPEIADVEEPQEALKTIKQRERYK